MRKKKDADKLAPPLPPNTHYSIYDIPPEGRHRYCYTCVRWFSEDEAYEFHVRAGHHVRTAEEWKDIQRQSRNVDEANRPSEQMDK